MRVLVICGQGMSTSLLVQNMYRYAQEGDSIKAASAGELKDFIQDVDVILVGPQIRYKLKSLQALAQAHSVKIAMIDARAYGRLDGAIAYQQSYQLYTRQE